MAPPRGTKRKSDESASASDHGNTAHDTAAQKVATKTHDAHSEHSPRKRQKTGISMAQKQALVDNLQLEITERARKLRAQYNLQAQGLRTRIEIRVNRIPMALRKAKMGELADKHKSGQQVKPTPSSMGLSASHSARPPPVPEKDAPKSRPISTTSAASHQTAASRPGPGRPPKRTSDEISDDADEKDAGVKNSEAPKKKARGNAAAVEADATKASKVLSPASANIRTMPRPMPGGKPLLTRAAPANENARSPTKSPVKQSSASNLFSSWAEKARSPRKNAASKSEKASASKTASSATGSTRGKKATEASVAGMTKGAMTTQTHRISGISESSESSTSTVAKKAASKAEKKEAPATGKRGRVMGTIRRGVAGAGSKKAAAAPKAASASTATGRVLRKRKE